MRKKGEENNLNEAGRRVIASHYRGAARLAWFMPGSRVGTINDVGFADLNEGMWAGNSDLNSAW